MDIYQQWAKNWIKENCVTVLRKLTEETKAKQTHSIKRLFKEPGLCPICNQLTTSWVKGKCKHCYRREYDKEYRRNYYTGNIPCNKCGRLVTHLIRGKCSTCYRLEWNRSEKGLEARKRYYLSTIRKIANKRNNLKYNPELHKKYGKDYFNKTNREYRAREREKTREDWNPYTINR